MFNTNQEKSYEKIKELEKRAEVLLEEIVRLNNIIDALIKAVDEPKEKPEYAPPGLFR